MENLNPFGSPFQKAGMRRLLSGDVHQAVPMRFSKPRLPSNSLPSGAISALMVVPVI